MPSQLVLTELAVVLAGVLLALLGARLVPARIAVGCEAALARPALLPLALGLATAIVYAWAWPGLLNPLPGYHDEAAYLFQSKLFASGRWSAPSPPLHGFFEQFHLLLEPRYASKYPPGHSLLLAPGVLLGAAALLPLVLNGVTAAFLVTVVRRVAGSGAAVASWLVWVTASLNLRWRPTYFSEVTTSMLVVVAWYSLQRWRSKREARWLVALALGIGWGAITRPLTMLAMAAPILVFVLLESLRNRQVMRLLPGVAAGGVVLLILPLWSQATTGTWGEWPLRRYTLEYQPFDRPGFGLPPETALRQAPEPMQRMFAAYQNRHAAHTIEGYLPEVWARTATLQSAIWSGWRGWFIPLAFIGMIVLGWRAVIPVSGAALHLVSHGLYAHPQEWTLYYLELGLVGAGLTGIGVAWLGNRLLASRTCPDTTARTVVFAVALAPLAGWFGSAELRRWKGAHRARTEQVAALHAAVAVLPDSQVTVFVRYPAGYIPHDTFIMNSPDLEAARAWFVHDLGTANRALLEYAPRRTPYLFDAGTGAVTRYQAPAP